MIAVKKSIPVPSNRIGPPLKYPWPKMEIGDSFKTEYTAQSIAWVGNKWAANRKLPHKFVQKKEGIMLRVWRIK